MLGTEKIEAIVNDIKDLVIVGKLVKEDGKIDTTDIVHLIAILPKLPKYISDFKAIGEAFEEGKDIDVKEAVELIQKIHLAIKEIENS
jgi:hypothetical protein